MTEERGPPRKNATKTRGRPFAMGNAGRPKGARHRVSLAVEALLAGEAEALTRKAIEAALGGDSTAMRLCLERIAPAPKERAVSFTAPTINGASDVAPALAAVIAAVANGKLLPGEGMAIAALIDRYRSAHETDQMERRLAALEAARNGARP
jgi:hypothetical protein